MPKTIWGAVNGTWGEDFCLIMEKGSTEFLISFSKIYKLVLFNAFLKMFTVPVTTVLESCFHEPAH